LSYSGNKQANKRDEKISSVLCARLNFDKSSAVAEKGDRWATTDMGRKVGAALPLSVVGAGVPI